jgi:ABC exporter DevB family membrane fusion protein
MVLAGAAAVHSFNSVPGSGAPQAAAALPDTGQAGVIAAAGRVEPVSEEIKVASQMAGRLSEVRVEEGDRVKKGDVVATVENHDYRAQLAIAEATLLAKEADLRRVMNGARGQERREAGAAVAESQAVLDNARAELERRHTLYASGDISRTDSERAEREFLVAKARVDATRERYSFVDAKARDEDRDRALADVAAARAQVELARATIEKTIVRSPVTGVVLRKHLKTGESVSDGPDTPILTLADDSVLRVRVDVDETDVAKVRVGQEAYVTADAYGDRKFRGHVVRVSQLLGKKNVRTDEPSERVDTKILETLVELNREERLPAGMRVNAFVVVK